MNPLTKILALRESGLVQRAHTVPYLGTYNIAIHCYNVVGLILLLHVKEPPSINLIKAALLHDLSERFTGDTPSPVKWWSQPIKNELDKLEMKVLARLGLDQCFNDLTEEETQWLNGADLLELWLWVQDQLQMGNKILKDMDKKILDAFASRIDKIPKEIQDFITNFKWQRLPELDELLEDK